MHLSGEARQAQHLAWNEMKVYGLISNTPAHTHTSTFNRYDAMWRLRSVNWCVLGCVYAPSNQLNSDDEWIDVVNPVRIYIMNKIGTEKQKPTTSKHAKDLWSLYAVLLIMWVFVSVCINKHTYILQTIFDGFHIISFAVYRIVSHPMNVKHTSTAITHLHTHLCKHCPWFILSIINRETHTVVEKKPTNCQL